MVRLAISCGGLFPRPELLEDGDIVLGGTAGLVALYARKVAKMYPGVVVLPLLMVLLMSEKESLRSCALKSPYTDWFMKRSSI